MRFRSETQLSRQDGGQKVCCLDCFAGISISFLFLFFVFVFLLSCLFPFFGEMSSRMESVLKATALEGNHLVSRRKKGLRSHKSSLAFKTIASLKMSLSV